MTEVTTVVEIDERGRATIPLPARKELDVVGERTTLEVTIRYGGD